MKLKKIEVVAEMFFSSKNKIDSVAVIGIVGVPACYGGFETLVENLLKNNNRPISVYCSKYAYEKRINEYKGALLYYIPLYANGFQSIAYDVICILHALKNGHRKLLILGVSGVIILPLIRILFPKVKIVTNIDGLEWKRGKWNFLIKSFLKFSEYLAIKFSDVIVSDNQAIADYLKTEYGVGSVVIAYGGDHALINNEPQIIKNYGLSLCRIEPENNIHIILEAFALTGQELKFIGNWSNSKYGRFLKDKYSTYTNIHLIEPVYDINKLFEYRSQCKFYLHGHSAGGTNPSLVEMLHFSKPIVAFDCIYNRATMENKGQYFRDVESLKNIIVSSGAWDNYDKDMSEIALRRYTWDIVRDQYFSLFD